MGFTKVILLLRGFFKVKPFDFSIDWVGKYANVNKMQFWQNDDAEERMKMINEGRNGGSINPPYSKILLHHAKNGALEIKTHTEVESASWDPHAQKWSFTFHRKDCPDNETHFMNNKQAPGSTVSCEADYLISSTGSHLGFSTLPFMRTLATKEVVPEVGGVPIVNEDLQYGSLPLYVIGSYSAIQIGPTAYNLGGIREGADRIAAKLRQLEDSTTDEEQPPAEAVKTSANSDVCLATLGEGEINAAASMTALLYSPKFNLIQTYFLINGIAGINPAMGTIGSVGFPQYAVQFGLQYGLDGREIPANWTGSFWNYGTSEPGVYPSVFYGTEVFGLNSALRDKVFTIASQNKLNDTQLAMDRRAAFPDAPANTPPAVFQGDVMTSDLYFTGGVFGDMASNLTLTLTNGTGAYALTAQEDNAVLETLVRAHKAGVADYGRAILYRSASNFDRAPPGSNDYEYFINATKLPDLITPAKENLYLVGFPIVTAVYWIQVPNSTLLSGYGDVFGTIPQ
ncbi:hypothetical protein MCAP1_003160 [Malassezia caprae]|uniref:Uncharacterized protein n=1 Tax=Malassezia caprae TaxID=1381934 RepID=A0AAF0J1D3_9BASI|nr:hypothetical protein MCAP1_003160 [Malassezia caprae]